MARGGAQQMLMYQKSMFDHYYCIKCFFFFFFFFFRLKTLEKLLQIVLFACTYNGAEKHVTCEHFENAASRAKTNIIASVHFIDDDVSFCDSPGMLIRNTAKPCINTWICAVNSMRHSFLCNNNFSCVLPQSCSKR